MSRNGAGVYSKPSGTTPVDGDDIDAAPYNLLMDDIAADLNLARPIVAGGTGAATAATALANLGGLAKASNLLDLANAAGARTNLGLVPQTSVLDATAARLLAVGAFGLGEVSAAPLLVGLDATTTPSGFYRYAATTTGTKPAGIAPDGAVIIAPGKDATSFTQLLFSGDGISIWSRACVTGVFTTWIDALSVFTDLKKGLAPASGGGAEKFLRADGTWSNPNDPSFVSVALNPTTDYRGTIAHGLGVAPRRANLIITCTSADMGFSVGDTIILSPGSYDPSSGNGVQISADATNIFLGLYQIVIRHKSTGTGGPGTWLPITSARWTMQVRAWK